MKKILLIVVMLIFITGCNNSKKYEIVNKYPHDTNTFTEGLFFYNGNFCLCDMFYLRRNTYR